MGGKGDEMTERTDLPDIAKALAFDALVKVLDEKLIAGDPATLERCASFARFMADIVLAQSFAQPRTWIEKEPAQ